VQQLRQPKPSTAPVPELLSVWLRLVSNTRTNRQNRVFPEADIAKRHPAEVERRAARRDNALDMPARRAQAGSQLLYRCENVGFLVEGVVQIPSTYTAFEV
jgi:hypothetical protein